MCTCVYKGFITSPHVFTGVSYVPSPRNGWVFALSELMGVTEQCSE